VPVDEALVAMEAFSLVEFVAALNAEDPSVLCDGEWSW
jgi:hypothetical protein